MTATTIRHVEETDADAVQQILTAPHVVRGTMRLAVTPRQYTVKRIAPADGAYKLVAVVGGEVAGFCELLTTPDLPRHSHAGEINLVATHPAFRGRDIGNAMMEAMLDLADNWLQLTRVGLIVWDGNETAIDLYRKHGFVIEGTMSRFVFCEGGYLDAHVMGRIR